MAKVANLAANLTADTATFEANLNRAGKKLDSVGSSMARSLASIDNRFASLGSTVEKFGGELFSIQGALGTFVGAGTITGLIALTRGALEAVGGLGELATQIGVSTDTLQAFQYAATQVGLSSDDMQTALARLSKTIGDAESGNKQAIDSFDALGVKILDAGGNIRPTDDIILDIANGLQRIQDPAKQAAAVVDLFGKSGQKLLPFLQDGADGVRQFIDQAKALGLVFDQDLIASADKAADKIAEMELRLSKLGQRAASLIAVPFNDLVDWSERFGKAQDDQTAKVTDFALHLEAVTQAQKDIASAQNEINLKTAAFNNDKSLGLNLYSKTQFDQDIKNLNDFIAAAQGRLKALQSGPDKGEMARRGIGTSPLDITGTSNPKPISTGKSPAEVNADKIKSKLDELNFALDQIGAPDLQQKINSNLKGIDLTMPGAKEGAAQISVLTKELQNNEIATEGAQAAKEADAEAEQQWQQVMARGQQVHESVRTATEEYADTVSNLSDLLQQGAISQDDYNRALDQANQKLQDSNPLVKQLKDDASDLGQAIGTAFEDAALSGKSLSEVLQGLLQDVARLLLRIGEKQLEGGFADLLGGILGGLGGGGSYSIGTSNAVTGMLGHAAGGGYIQVGEQGPELFKPAVSGTIIPHDAIGNSNNITIAPSFNIQASGGTQDQNKDLAAQLSKQIVPQIRQLVQGELQTQMRAGGMLNRGYGGA